MQRTFIAVDMDDEVRNAAARAQSALQTLEAHVRWVDVDAMHLTLKFLGDTPDGLLSEVSDILRDLCADMEPFTMRLRGVTAFPSPSRPRTIAVPVEAPEALYELNAALEEASEEFGLGREDRRFKPHLTLGRVKSRKGTEALVQRIHEMKDTEFGETTVDEVVYCMSELRRTGARYTPLYRAPLKGQGSRK